jgi:hypothetical protein
MPVSIDEEPPFGKETRNTRISLEYLSNQPGDSQNGATRTLNPIEICGWYFHTTGTLVPVKPVGSAPY